MKILEVRDGFIKFEADSSICLSSFIKVSGFAKYYIAQVIQVKLEDSTAIAKILFLYDGNLQPYDKTLPPDDAEITDFTFNILNNSINADEPVIAGEMPVKDLSIIIDSSSFNKKMIISIDDKEENNILIRNFTRQFNNINKNVLIIDTLGIVNAKKFVAGIDFKLPLDTDSLAFMYTDCLNDATSDSKYLIIEIFRDLAEYSQTVPFVPFGALKNIIDDMVDKSHIFKLLVLKNKLKKFDQLGFFAKDKYEVDKIEKILNSKCAIVDLSGLDTAFQNRYLAFLYDKLKSRENTQIFLELSNTISKKNLKNILNSPASTTFVTHSKFKYLNDIKNLFDNFIISPSPTNNEIFKIYSKFLKSMPKETYLIAGEALNYIPLISSSKLINEVIPRLNVKEEDITKNPETTDSSETIIEPQISITEEPAETNDSNAGFSEDEKDSASDEINQSGIDNNGDENIEEIISSDDEVMNDDVQTEATEESAENNLNEVGAETTDNVSIVEPEIIDGIETPLEEKVENNEEKSDDSETIEKHIISNEEILANIEERADAAITEAAKDLSLPAGVMFETDNNETLELDEDELEDLETSLEEVEGTSFEDDSSIEITPDSLENDIKNLANDKQIQEKNEQETELDENDTLMEEAFNDNNEPQDNKPDEQVNYLETEESTDYSLLEDLEGDNTEIDSIEDIGAMNETEELEIPDEFDIDTDDTELHENSSSGIDNIMHEYPSEDINVIPINDDIPYSDEITELDPDEARENDIVIDIDDYNEIEPKTEELPDEQLEDLGSEELDEQIVKDVDKVFTTRKSDEDISDSDLDFIDELNSEENDLLQEVNDDENLLEEISDNNDNEDGIIDEQTEPTTLEEVSDDDILETRNSSTPIVPVYNADIPQEDLVISDPIQQGDVVTHAKYGSGIVEKMIKYGNKTLFSINFDNIGRRLLDPTLTEIKKA